jgi:hypothetical protein
MSLLVLSAEPLVLSPDVLLRLGLLPCLSCGQRGPHRLIGATGSAFTALCSRCGDPQLAQQALQGPADVLHPSSGVAGCE